MTIKRITVIVPTEFLNRFERCLRAAGAPGMTLDNVRGFGEHVNYFSRDLLRGNVRIEVYIGGDRCDEVCEAICNFAGETHTSAGILAVEPVERLIDLNSGNEIPAENL